MRTRPWRVALIDSGLDPASKLVVQARCSCESDGSVHLNDEARLDVTRHGTRVANVICSAAQVPGLFVAQVLNEHGRATAGAVASAIDWSLGEHVDLIHMSLGLAADRPDLAAAVARAVNRGTIVIASAPARGARPFPARYPGVVAATGDARCEPGQISALRATNADFGGCVHLSTDGTVPGRGASIGAAHVTRFIVEHVVPGSSMSALRLRLEELATHQGVERR